ncbi:MAG: hypothetical protein LAO76_26945 [Acidobacteriia bacterium]|nr:hypothetical protein [Terriglobia bacterium]
MEAMSLVRRQVSSILNADFFLSQADLDANYEDERIAQVVNGASYERTKRRVSDFISRCEQTLSGLRQRVEQAKAELDGLAAKATATQPGSGPSSFFVDRSNPNSVARYNEKVDKYNAQLELHRRIVDQAGRAKERYEDVTAKLEDKKAELDEQVREKLEELKPALDQDILTLLGKLQQLAYDNLHNKGNLFAGFLLSYVTKRAYVFLYDRIQDTVEQRAATDIFNKLNAEFNTIMTTSGEDVGSGLRQAAEFLLSCYQSNAVLLKNIQDSLQALPYQQCKDAVVEIQRLLSFAINTSFEYGHIIDPSALAKVESEVRARKALFSQQVQAIDRCSARLEPVFSAIAAIQSSVDSELSKMNSYKMTVFDPAGKDVLFALSVLEEENQDRYLKQHKPWLQCMQKEIEQKLGEPLNELVKNVVDTALLTQTAKDKLAADAALCFYSFKSKLAQIKTRLLDGIKSLDSTLQEIDELPRQKSREFARKMSLWLNLSLLPLGNLFGLVAIIGMTKTYLPAFMSSNITYAALRQRYVKKYQVYSYIHIVLMLGCTVWALLAGTPVRPVLWAVTITYVLSTAGLYAKGRQLKTLGVEPVSSQRS